MASFHNGGKQCQPMILRSAYNSIIKPLWQKRNADTLYKIWIIEGSKKKGGESFRSNQYRHVSIDIRTDVILYIAL